MKLTPDLECKHSCACACVAALAEENATLLARVGALSAARMAVEDLISELNQMAEARQQWADHPDIGGKKPGMNAHLRGKRYGYSHAAQLLKSRVLSLQK